MSDPADTTNLNPDTGWTPEDLIRMQAERAAAASGAPVGNGIFAPFSGLANGIASGLGYGNAEAGIRGNQAAAARAYQNMPAVTDQASLAKYLLSSGIPSLQQAGFNIFAENLDPIHQSDQILKQIAARQGLRFENDPYGTNVAPPNGATARAMPIAPPQAGSSAPAAPQQPQPQQGSSAAAPAPSQPSDVTVNAVKSAVLGESNPAVATQNWRSLIADPQHGNAIRAYFNASGEHPANVQQAANMFVNGAAGAKPAAPGAPAGAAPPQGVAPQQPPPQTTGSVAPPNQGAASDEIPNATPAQRWALAALSRDRMLANNMMIRQQNPQAAAAVMQRVQDAEKTGMYMVPGVGMVNIPGYGAAAAANKLAETTGQKDAEYYDSVHKGYTGTATIAAQQKQNIAVARQVASDPGFASGSGQGLQLATQRALATMGIKPEAATPREIFNMIMARIKADQLSGMRSLSSEAGEGATRIFKSFADLEAEAMPNESDSQQGILKKLDVLDQAGTLAMQWGNMADNYKLASPNGQLDARFDKFMRATVANARIPGYEGTGGGKQEGVPAAAAPPMTHEQIMALPDGQVLNLPGGGQGRKVGDKIIPVSGNPGERTNPFANKTDVTGPGQYAYENGKVYRRTPNYFTDRWEEVK